MDRRVITDEQLDVLLRNTLQEKADCIEISNRLKKKIDDEIGRRLEKRKSI